MLSLCFLLPQPVFCESAVLPLHIAGSLRLALLRWGLTGIRCALSMPAGWGCTGEKGFGVSGDVVCARALSSSLRAGQK